MRPFEYVRPGAVVVRGYAEKLVGGIPEELFARLPRNGGDTVLINHPAFVLGHLSLYPLQIAQMVGVPATGMEIPATYPDLFKIGSVCHDDPDRVIYPHKEELVTHFLSATDALIASLDQIDPRMLDQELENPSRRERFGKVGAFVMYILLAHPQVHLGQVSAWRRCMGLGAV